MFTPQELQEIQLFLGLLYPWTDPEKDLYKTISWTFVGKDGVGHLANYTAQSMPDLIRLIETRTKRAGANVYLSLSTQLLADTTVLSTDGYAKAIRRHDNIVSSKSIYLDIDVGKKDAYATTQDAFDALDDFIAKVGLPEPTMIVLSGSGGMHVYWCFNDPIPLAQWKPLAAALRDAGLGYGLKFDPQVTVNPVGILRVPNTYNHKTTPPKKVTMYHEEGETFPRYGYQQMLGMLGAYTNTAHLRQGPGVGSERTKNFTEGVSESSPPVSIDDVAANCLVIDDILDRGGNGDAEPLWNMALYAAAFTTDPFGAAHRLSDKDPRYTRDGTDKKLLEKINARASNPAAGWPKCEQFSALHPGCATCPLFAYKKSPFNHARRAERPQAQEFMPAAGNDELMPRGYWRNKEGHVCGTIYPPKQPPFPAVIIDYPILDGGIDPMTGDLIYRAKIGGVEVWRDLTVSANTQPASMAGAMSKGNGLYINPKNYSAARDFFVSWVSHLQTVKRMANSHTFGWTNDGKGFVYDDKLYGPDTTDIVHRGKHADPSFKVVGELKPWQNAMQLVYGNMPLEATVATAFAAPLVELVGSSSLVVSIYSALSGIGKTTAMMLAQAVWGHPRTGMSALMDTQNSVMKKIADLKSLPVYWDELKTKDQLDQIVELVFQVTQGKGKARLTRDIAQADAPSFTTMFVVASNLGIADSVYAQTESTEAGGLRVFEIAARQLANPISNHKAGQLIIPVQSNYGYAGAAYAEWLARNKKVVMQVLAAVSDDMETRHKFTPKERYWRLTMETILVGATLANHCGLTQFDIEGLSDFLDDTLKSLRADMKQQEYMTMSTSLDIKGLLQEMISDLRGSGNLIITDTIQVYVGPGKPPKIGLVYPPFLADLLRLGDVWAQMGQQDGRLRIRRRPFDAWFRKRNINTKTIIDGLKQHYLVLNSKTTIGAGIDGLDASSRIGQTACYDFIPLPPSPGSGEPN